MQRTLLILGVALCLASLAHAGDEESEALTQEGGEHMDQAERALLGYINVHGTRAQWINKNHPVHPIGNWSPSPTHHHRHHHKRAHHHHKRHHVKTVYKYRRFPLQKFLGPLRHLAHRVSRQRSRSWKRYQRLRRLMETTGLLNPEHKKRVHHRVVKKVVRTARERALERELASLQKKIAAQEAQDKQENTPHCNAPGTVFFCFRGRCACAQRADALCVAPGSRLVCRAAQEVGTVCRCTHLSSAALRRQHAAAEARKPGFWKHCNRRTPACKRARAVHFGQHKLLRKWAHRRIFLTKMYNRMYRRYVELLARYFKKKFLIMIHATAKNHQKNAGLRKQLHDLVIKHKNAMLKHAKMHHLAFVKFGKLMDDYNALDAKYNALVDKYTQDMSHKLDRIKLARSELDHERVKVHHLRQEKSELEAKIKFLESEVAKHKARHEASEAANAKLFAEHAKLKAQYEESKRATIAAIHHHEAQIKQLEDEIAKTKEEVDDLQQKLDETQANAKAASDKAERAYTKLQAKYDDLKKRTDDAAAHDAAAEAALKNTNQQLTDEVSDLKARAHKHFQGRAARRAARAKKFHAMALRAKQHAAAARHREHLLKHKLHRARKALARALALAKRRHALVRRIPIAQRTKSGKLHHLYHMASVFRHQIHKLTHQVRQLRGKLSAARAVRQNAVKKASVSQHAARVAVRDARALRYEYDQMRRKYRKDLHVVKAREAVARRLQQRVRHLRARRDQPHHHHHRHGHHHHHHHHHGPVPKCGQTFEAARNANKALFAHNYDGYDFYRVRVHGHMSSDNIARTCASHNLQTVCDHPAYADGRCTVVVKRPIHFSMNTHRSFPAWIINHTFWYTNQARSLRNIGHTHRWSNGNDRNGHILCALPAPCHPKVVTWHGYKFYRVRVEGKMTNPAIHHACKVHGLETPCDHPAYVNGKCVTVMKRALFMSYSPHNDFPRKDIDRTYWYTGNNAYPLQNWRGTHRWAAPGDNDGLTLCVAPAVSTNPRRVVSRYHGFDWFRVRVHGEVTNAKIHAACHKYGYQTPCDHPAYANGKCTDIVKQGLHLSYAPHGTLPRAVSDRMYFYTGNQAHPLQAFQNTHRWSDAGDRHGDTLCVKRRHVPNPKKIVATWHGYRFHRVLVHGEMTNANIRATCAQHHLETPCDHPAYADGTCVTVLKTAGHMSFNGHHNFPRKLIDRTYWYTGANRFPLQNWHNTHRWATIGDRNSITMCVSRVGASDSHKQVGQWHGYAWFRVRVPGHMSNQAIHHACHKLHLQTPCDHPAYADGKCTTVVKRALHLSYAPHTNMPNRIRRNMFFYTGQNRWPLEAIHHTHQWATAGDKDGDTLCIKKLPTPQGYQFTFNGFQFFRVHVHGEMTAAAVRNACESKNLFTPCDHPAYADGHCIAITKRPIHLSYNPSHGLDRKAMNRCYFYAGGERKLLQDWRNTHRWSDKGDRNGDTMCVTPVPVDPKVVVADWHGHKFHQVLVEGAMTNHNIRHACAAQGLRTPCDHPAYADGKCVVIFKHGHMSFNGHHNFPRNIIDRTYWYTGHNRMPLQDWHNTHRWATDGDMWETTLCIE